METRATTIKCVNLGYDALIDMFKYKNNSYELYDVCRGLTLSHIKVSEVVWKVLKVNHIVIRNLA